MAVEVYHEKQVRELCALHVLNNLFQQKDAFLRSELDAICIALAPKVWLNPHRSILGWGNYDVNVIMTALQNKGYEVIWFDKRKDPSCLKLNAIFGFIMNIPNDYHLGLIRLPINRRHWIAIKKIDENYYNLDSKLKAPISIGNTMYREWISNAWCLDKNDENLIRYLQQQIKNKDNQLFVVVNTSDSGNWQNDKPLETEIL